MKKLLGTLLAAVMMLTMFQTATFAAGIDFKVGDQKGVVVGSYDIPVTKTAAAGGSETMVYPGTEVKVLQSYVVGKGNDKFHKIKLSDGTKGYILAYINGKDTLEIKTITEIVYEGTNKDCELEQRPKESSATSETVKYGHDIDMNFLSDYIYGGSKAQSGKDCDTKRYLPKEWRMHECPSSLPIVAKGIIHVGDEGKLSNVRASFLPTYASSDYHERRLAELKAIGYDVVIPQPAGEGNTAFYCMATTEFDVVAYNDEWVAVWSLGGVDTSRGMGAICWAYSGIQYGSWKSGVYFIPRKYCYILDINNQINYTPELQGKGKATRPLMVKTTPDSDDYIKSGVYKINQAFPIVDATPKNGHYQIYYKNGLYYVEAKYVNLQLSGVKKPLITDIAEVKDGTKTAPIQSTAGGETVAEVKAGATIDVMQKDCGNGYSKIWFNTKECYIETEYLTNFQATPAASGLSELGTPVGTLVIDSSYADSGQKIYSASELEVLKKTNYGDVSDLDMKLEYMNVNDNATKMWESEWVNVYKIEDFKSTPKMNPKFSAVVQGKVYTVVYDGMLRYIVQRGNQKETFTYYPGNGYSKIAMAGTQELYIDAEKYSALAYNINDNNYFKLRDIAKMMDGTVKCFEIEYDAETNTIDMMSLFPYTPAGGELTPGDGTERTAYSSTAFLTYDGMPIKATCYNIEGNNYFKLRDITDALDCRVEWDDQNHMIKVYTSLPAYDDPSEPVG